MAWQVELLSRLPLSLKKEVACHVGNGLLLQSDIFKVGISPIEHLLLLRVPHTHAHLMEGPAT